MITTLNKIRLYAPCEDGWRKLLSHLGKTKADDEPLHLRTILGSNGLSDALWCLRAVDGHAREMRLFAVWCARQVQEQMSDTRSVAALDVAERYANGLATDAELTAAKVAAWRATEENRWSAARDAALATAREDAWNAARGAADQAAWETERGTAVADEAWGASWYAQTVELRRVLDCIDAGVDPYPMQEEPK